MSPKIYLGEYNQKCDIYSYGMTVLEMVTNSRPYCKFETPFQIFHAVTTGPPPKIVQELILNLCKIPSICASEM